MSYTCIVTMTKSLNFALASGLRKKKRKAQKKLDVLDLRSYIKTEFFNKEKLI